MTIGPDIKEAIVEVGTKYNIIRDAGDIPGEYLDFESNAQVTKPFIREFFLEGQLTYDSQVVAGDTIQFTTTLKKYFIMNVTPEMFENTIISYQAVLYKTNEVVTIYRPSEQRNVNTYLMETTWIPVETNRPILITAPLFGIDLETDEQLGLIGLQIHEVFVPTNYDIQVLDRFHLSSGEYFRVEAIKKRRFEGVDVLEVGEDTRPTTTTTTSTTSTTTTTA
jgi:hypothetical protein